MEIKFVRRLQDGLLGLKSPTANELQTAVAYVTSDGLDAVNALGIKIVRATVGVAHQITEPEALMRLQSSGSQIRIADVVGEFHPKVYLKHAWDRWESQLFFVSTEDQIEQAREKYLVGVLMGSYWRGWGRPSRR